METSISEMKPGDCPAGPVVAKIMLAQQGPGSVPGHGTPAHVLDLKIPVCCSQDVVPPNKQMKMKERKKRSPGLPSSAPFSVLDPNSLTRGSTCNNYKGQLKLNLTL